MAVIQEIGIGALPDDGNGDTIRVAFTKVNSNDSNLNADIATNTSNISTNASNISTNTSNISTNSTDITDLENIVNPVSDKITQIDNIVEVSSNRDITNTDSSKMIYLDDGVTINFPTGLTVSKVFNFRCDSTAITGATISFNSALVGEDGNTGISSIEVNAGETVLVFSKSTGEYCINQ